MTLYKSVLEVREYNMEILNKYKAEPGYFNNPHILLVGLNPKLTKNQISDYELISKLMPENIRNNETLNERFHEKSYRGIITSWAKKVDLPLNYMVDLTSPWVSYTNLVKVPTKSEGQLTDDEIDEWTKITKNQINIFNPNLVIVFSKKAAVALIGDHAEVGKYYDIDGVTYYVVYHYAYFSRKGGDAVAYRYFMQEKEKINEYLKKNAVIKVTDNFVYYMDINGNKQKYQNPAKLGNLYYIPDPNGKFESVFGDRLSVGDPKLNSKNFQSFDAGLSRTTWFLLQNKVKYTKYYNIIAFDIETNFCNTPDNPVGEVLIISTINSRDDKKISFVFKHHENQAVKGRGEVRSFDFEEDMLRAFFAYLHEGFDILTGWFSNNFDVPYVFNRAKVLNISPADYVQGLSVKQEKNKSWRLFVEEGYLFDSLEEDKAVTSGGAPGYSLNARSKDLFNEQKLDVSPSQIPELWENDINHLLDYCMRDTELLGRIIAVDDIFARIRIMQSICPINADIAHYNSRIIEMSLRYDNPHLKFPTKVHGEDGDKTSGIVVLTPSEGLRRNEVVYDFSGMYSTIITTFNISPDRVTTSDTNVTKINGIKFDVSKIGVIPALELKIISLRKEFERKRDEFEVSHPKYKEYGLKRDYVKTLGNSLYGVLSYKKFILYNPKVSQAIIDIEGVLIMFVKEFAERNGLKVDYGDTDSVFINFPEHLTVDELIIEAEKFNVKLNIALREFAKTLTTNEQLEKVYTISIGIDKIYSKFYMTDKKKRYFGWLVAKKGKKHDKPSLDVMGFETRRKDTPDFFKPIYFGLYSLVLNKRVDSIIRFSEVVKKVLHQKGINDLISRIKLGKNVGDLEGDEEDDRMGDYKVKSTSWKAVMNGGVKIYRGDTLNLVHTTKGPTHYSGQDIEVDYNLYYQKFFVDKVKLVNEELYNLVKPESKPRKKRKKKEDEKVGSLDVF